MKVLLSIKPEFVEKIFSGAKRYEFRRNVFKNPEVKTVVVYASSPVQKIVGEFEIGRIINDELTVLWNMTKEYAGISEDYFMDYFAEKENGYAIQIKKTKKYKQALCLRETYNTTPPQSFMYLEAESA